MRSKHLGLLAVLVVAAIIAGRTLPAGAQAPPSSVDVYQGTTHVAYLGPTLPVVDALNNASEFVTSIWYFDNRNQNAPWKLWSAGLPDAIQGFTELVFGQAYFTVGSRTFLWEFADGATPPLPDGVDLVAGDNSIVYLGPTQSVDSALGLQTAGLATAQLAVAQAGPPINSIWRNDPGRNMDQPWFLWSADLPPPLRQIQDLVFGQAYVINAGAAGTLPFDHQAAPCVLCNERPSAGESDFGDAPLSYEATNAGGTSNAAWHAVEDGFFLGDAVDSEPNVQSSPDAKGDDRADGRAFYVNDVVEPTADDEDGVQFLTPLRPGQEAEVRILAIASEFQFSAVSRYLNAWIDVNQNGRFDHPAEHVIDDFQLEAGPNIIAFMMPNGVPDAREFVARFRLSHSPDVGPIGLGGQGEVEDYFTTLDDLATFDYGDAPESYQTLKIDDGARHRVDPDIYIGRVGMVDTEMDGQPSFNANDDDIANDDEDAFLFTGPITSAGHRYQVWASVDGFIDGWVDFDGDGEFHPVDERVLDSEPVIGGQANSIFVQPTSSLIAGERYARFRFSTAGGLGPTGPAPDGEVEDYRLQFAADHTMTLFATFSGGTFTGLCSRPPLAGFTDTYIVTANANGSIRLEQPSTGDINDGHWNADGTFSASSVTGEMFVGTWGADWSLWGDTWYPDLSQPGCIFHWIFHMEIELPGF